MKMKYYDGHYPDRGKTLEELEKELEEILEKEKELTDWPEIN